MIAQERETIEHSLELAAQAFDDPTPDVFARMFEVNPEYESLFVMDTDGGVRGSMLQQAIECILDHVAGGHAAGSILSTQCMDHEGYGVPTDQFMVFFVAMRDVFREALGVRWTGATEQAWSGLLAELETKATG